MFSPIKANQTSGYSGTPLAKKLGIKTGFTVAQIGPPAHYHELLAPIPEGVVFQSKGNTKADIVHVFVTERRELAKLLTTLRKSLRPETPVWISWPKKASKVPTDITEDVIREIALPMDWVDIKVCAVDAVWSGLKLVVRKSRRDPEP